MKILLQVSSLSYKTYHYLAIRIKEKYPDCEFAIIGSNKHGKEFFAKDYNIQYSFFDDISDVKVKLKDSINFEIIKNFEKDAGLFVWKIVSSDRRLGGVFLHNSLGYNSKYQSNKKYILKSVEHRIVHIDNIFKKFKPDIFIPAMAMGNIDVGIYEGMCKIYNTQYAVVTVSRVKNYCAFSSNTMLNLDKIDIETRDLISSKSTPSQSAEKLYNDLIDEIKKPVYFDSDIEKIESETLLKRINIFAIYVLFKPIYLYMVACFNSLLFREKSCNFKNDFVKWFVQGLQLIKVSSPKFGKKLEINQKYLYYPLHITPEYSTLIQGGMIQDQISIIEFLAKSVPADWVIYVKEHPATLKNRIRPLDFYHKIKSIPNVEIAPTYLDMHKLISNAEMVAVITGTSGFEAVLRGVPVIEFSDYISIYDPLGLSEKCTDLNKLSGLILDTLLNVKHVTCKEKAFRIKILLTSILNNSFAVTFPKQLFYDEVGTDYEYSVCGKELADGLIKHLDL